MKIHALARADYLMSHIEPIHAHLTDEQRGERLVDPHLANAHVKHWGKNDIVMVASYIDIAAAQGRPVIYVEHGAGQSYSDARGEAKRYYHGGEHPDNVIGYIGPRQSVIDVWGQPGYAAGAPVCDPYQLFAPERVCAITFHWNGASPAMVGVPEAGTAFEHYHRDMGHIISTLQAEGWEVLGHRHPKRLDLVSFWHRHGIREATVEEVRTRAALLIADNTSLMFELMYLGRDVIALNSPEYRRDVEHGLRFWEMAHDMTQVDSAVELVDLIPEIDTLNARGSALCDLSVPERVYGKALSDGHDGARAAAWLTKFVHEVTA